MPRFDDLRILALPAEGIITPTILCEIMRSFNDLGAETSMPRCPNMCEETIEIIRGFAPDFVFTLNYIFSRDYPDALAGIGIPHVTWFVDLPRGLGLRRAYEGDVFFATDEDWLEYVRGAGGAHTHYLPLCTNPGVFQPTEDGGALEPYRAGVSFLGSSIISDDFERLAAAENMTEYLKQVFMAIVDGRVKRPGEDVDSLIRRCVPEDLLAIFTDERSKGLVLLLMQHAAHLERISYMSSLGSSAHVYGDEGWNICAPSGLRVHGRLDPVSEAPLLYQASNINMNFSAGQLITGVKQRVFDAGACGGFVLTDYRPDLRRLFDFDNEIVCFQSLEGMMEKVGYYLEHEDERRAIADRARKRILAEHTYMNRARIILETFISIYR